MLQACASPPRPALVSPLILFPLSSLSWTLCRLRGRSHSPTRLGEAPLLPHLPGGPSRKELKPFASSSGRHQPTPAHGLQLMPCPSVCLPPPQAFPCISTGVFGEYQMGGGLGPGGGGEGASSAAICPAVPPSAAVPRRLPQRGCRRGGAPHLAQVAGGEQGQGGEGLPGSPPGVGGPAVVTDPPPYCPDAGKTDGGRFPPSEPLI